MPYPKVFPAGLLCTLLVVSACEPHRPAPSPSPAASVEPTAVPTLSPVPATSILPARTSTPVPTATPTATPSPVLAAPDAPPRILDVHLSSTQMSPGDEISGYVTTTSNVASLEARIATYSLTVPKTGVGLFHMNYKVPDIPFFLHGNYTIVFIARNTRGDRVTRELPIVIR